MSLGAFHFLKALCVLWASQQMQWLLSDFVIKNQTELLSLFEMRCWCWNQRSACLVFSTTKYENLANGLMNCLTCSDLSQKCSQLVLHSSRWSLLVIIFAGVVMHCVKEEHAAINMNLHYLENGCVMLNFIFQKELFFLPLGFALKVNSAWIS